jgi:ribose 1,5-bisphosphokinase
VDVRARFANVLVVVVTAPPDILAARLAGRSRGSDGKLELRIKRNDIFADFEPDLTINNAGAPESAVRLFLEAINSR